MLVNNMINIFLINPNIIITQTLFHQLFMGIDNIINTNNIKINRNIVDKSI